MTILLFYYSLINSSHSTKDDLGTFFSEKSQNTKILTPTLDPMTITWAHIYIVLCRKSNKKIFSASENKAKDKDAVPRVIIVAIVLGLILFVIIFLMIITCCIKQRKENRRREEKKLGKIPRISNKSWC